MTAQEYLQDKTLTEVEIVYGRIVSLICGKDIIGLDIDMTGIPNMVPVRKTSMFTLEGNILTASGITVDLSKTKVLT